MPIDSAKLDTIEATLEARAQVAQAAGSFTYFDQLDYEETKQRIAAKRSELRQAAVLKRQPDALPGDQFSDQWYDKNVPWGEDPSGVGKAQTVVNALGRGLPQAPIALAKTAGMLVGAIPGVETQNTWPYRAGEWAEQGLAQAAPAGKGLEESFGYNVLPETIGQLGGQLGLASLGVPPLATGVALESSSQYDDARAHGLSDNRALLAGLAAAPLGVFESMVPEAALAGKFKGLTPKFLSGIPGADRALATLFAGGLEATTESGQTVGENFIANTLMGYDPDRPMFEGVGTAGGAGGIAGGLVGLLTGGRARHPSRDVARTAADHASQRRELAAAQEEEAQRKALEAHNAVRQASLDTMNQDALVTALAAAQEDERVRGIDASTQGALSAADDNRRADATLQRMDSEPNARFDAEQSARTATDMSGYEPGTDPRAPRPRTSLPLGSGDGPDPRAGGLLHALSFPGMVVHMQDGSTDTTGRSGAYVDSDGDVHLGGGTYSNLIHIDEVTDHLGLPVWSRPTKAPAGPATDAETTDTISRMVDGAATALGKPQDGPTQSPRSVLRRLRAERTQRSVAQQEAHATHQERARQEAAVTSGEEAWRMDSAYRAEAARRGQAQDAPESQFRPSTQEAIRQAEDAADAQDGAKPRYHKGKAAPATEVYHGSKTREAGQPIDLKRASENNEHGTAAYVTQQQLEAGKYGKTAAFWLKGNSLDEESKTNKKLLASVAEQLKKLGKPVPRAALTLAGQRATMDVALQEIGIGLREAHGLERGVAANDLINKALSKLDYTSRSYVEGSGARSYAVWDMAHLVEQDATPISPTERAHMVRVGAGLLANSDANDTAKWKSAMVETFRSRSDAVIRELPSLLAESRAAAEADTKSRGESTSTTATGREAASDRKKRSLDDLERHIPPAKRVFHAIRKGMAILDNMGRRFSDRPDLPDLGPGLLTGGKPKQQFVDGVFGSSVSRTPAGAQAIAELAAKGEHLLPRDAEFWDRALKLPNRARFWYEVSAEKFQQHVRIPQKLFAQFIDLVAATSAKTPPLQNLARGLSLLSEHVRDSPMVTDIFSRKTVRDALQGSVISRKFGSFANTFLYHLGLSDTPSLSTNDRQVASSFNVSDGAVAQDGRIYEVLSRFYLGMAEEMNRHLPEGAQPYEAWQIQALGWVQQRNDNNAAEAEQARLAAEEAGDEYVYVEPSSDDYWHAIDILIKRLNDAGVATPGDVIDMDVLKDPRVTAIMSRTSTPFVEAAKGIIGIDPHSSEDARAAFEWADKIRSGAVVARAGALKAFDGIVKRFLGKIGNKGREAVTLKVLPSVIDEIATVIIGRRTSISRQDVDAISTFDGEPGRRLRFPFPSQMTDREIRTFLSVIGAGIGAREVSSARFVPVTDATPSDAPRSRSAFVRGEQMTREQIDAVSAAVGYDVDGWLTANGTVLDFHGDASGAGPTEDAVSQAISDHTSGPFSVKSVHYQRIVVSDYEFDGHIEEFGNAREEGRDVGRGGKGHRVDGAEDVRRLQALVERLRGLSGRFDAEFRGWSEEFNPEYDLSHGQRTGFREDEYEYAHRRNGERDPTDPRGDGGGPGKGLRRAGGPVDGGRDSEGRGLPGQALEVHDKTKFWEALRDAKAGSAFGAFVTLGENPEFYANHKTFVAPDGSATFAVAPDGDMVALAKSDSSTVKGWAETALRTSVANGGKMCDNFDRPAGRTVGLPDFYSRGGFRVVSRVAFNEEYAPEGWNYARDGKPDVVFMVFDGVSKAYNGDEGSRHDNYDDAKAVQVKAAAAEAAKSRFRWAREPGTWSRSDYEVTRSKRDGKTRWSWQSTDGVGVSSQGPGFSTQEQAQSALDAHIASRNANELRSESYKPRFRKAEGPGTWNQSDYEVQYDGRGTEPRWSWRSRNGGLVTSRGVGFSSQAQAQADLDAHIARRNAAELRSEPGRANTAGDTEGPRATQAQLDELTADLRRMGGDKLAIEFQEALKRDPNDPNTPVLGRYFRGVIAAALGQSASSMKFTLRHEFGHWLMESESSPLTEDEKDAIWDTAARKTYGEEFKNDEDWQDAIHEAVADEFANWYEARKDGGVHALAKVFQKIQDFLEKLGNLMRNRGFVSMDSVFGDIASGKALARHKATPGRAHLDGDKGRARKAESPRSRKRVEEDIPGLEDVPEADGKPPKKESLLSYILNRATDHIATLGKGGDYIARTGRRTEDLRDEFEGVFRAKLEPVFKSPEFKALPKPKQEAAKKMLGTLVEGTDLDAALVEAQRDIDTLTDPAAKRDAQREKNFLLRAKHALGGNPAEMFDSRPLRDGDDTSVLIGDRKEPRMSIFRGEYTRAATDTKPATQMVKFEYFSMSKSQWVEQDVTKENWDKICLRNHSRSLKPDVGAKWKWAVPMVQAWRSADDWAKKQFNDVAGVRAAGEIENHWPHLYAPELREALSKGSQGGPLASDARARALARMLREAGPDITPEQRADIQRAAETIFTQESTDPVGAALRRRMGPFEKARSGVLRPHLIDYSEGITQSYAGRAGLATGAFKYFGGNVVQDPTGEWYLEEPARDARGRRILAKDPNEVIKEYIQKVLEPEYGTKSGDMASEYWRGVQQTRGSFEGDMRSHRAVRALSNLQYGTKLLSPLMWLGNMTQTFTQGMIMGPVNITKGWALAFNANEVERNRNAGIHGDLSMLDSPLSEPDPTHGLVSDIARKIANNPLTKPFRAIEGLNNLIAGSAGWLKANDLLAAVVNGTERTNARRGLDALLGTAQNDPVQAARLLVKIFDLTEGQVERAKNSGEFDWEAEKQIRLQASKQVNFRSGENFQPKWMTSPHFSLFRPFKSFIYNSSRHLVRNVVGELKHGNTAPLYATLLGAGLTGELVNLIKNALQGRERESEYVGLFKTNEVADKLALRFLEDVSVVGTLGLLERPGQLIEARFWGGPNVSTLANAFDFGREMARRPDLKQLVVSMGSTLESQVSVVRSIEDATNIAGQTLGSKRGEFARAYSEARSLQATYLGEITHPGVLERVFATKQNPDIPNEYAPEGDAVSRAIAGNNIVAAMEARNEGIATIMKREGISHEAARTKLQAIVMARSPLNQVGQSDEKLRAFWYWAASRSGKTPANAVAHHKYFVRTTKALFHK